MSWVEHHKRSERLASEAQVALFKDRKAEALELYAQAADAEDKALADLDKSKVHTVGISAVSAASLHYKAGDLEKAGEVADEWLRWPALPDFARNQLRSLQRSIPKDLHHGYQKPERAVTVREDAPKVLFDAYLMVDWSAKQKRATGSDSIWFALLERTGPPRPSLKAVLRNPATRSEARERLGEALGDLKRRGKRVLVGFDFPFGYPQGTALALGLRSDRPAWLNLWREFDGLVRDEPDNSNNRFSVADQLNQRVPTDGPFWGRPDENKYDPLEHLEPSRPSYSDDLPEKRLCEKRVPKAQPVWKLHGAGSVGGQTLTGLPVLQALCTDERIEGDCKIWPFETGLTSPDEGSIVFAEIYPSLLRHEFTPLVKDASQVLAMALHFAELDEERALAKAFEGDPELTREERTHIECEEGWILGVTGEEPTQLQLPPMTLEHDPASSSASLHITDLKAVDVEQRASAYVPTGPILLLNRILGTWRLGQPEAIRLLGLDPSDKGYVTDVLTGRKALKGRDANDRLAYLIQIRMALFAWFRDEEVENDWLREAHAMLDDKVPLELLLEGSMENLLLVKEYVEAATGW